jgi:hypothetical protein
MKSIASRIGLSFVLVALVFAIGASPARAEAITIMENTVMSPQSFNILVSCAAGGAGELVDFSGYFHNIYSFTGSSGGPVSYRFHTLAQNITGIGQITGDSYVYSGGFLETGTLSMGELVTTVFDFRVIGQGSGNNFVVHTVIHYTINANGELVIDFYSTDAICV